MSRSEPLAQIIKPPRVSNKPISNSSPRNFPFPSHFLNLRPSLRLVSDRSVHFLHLPPIPSRHCLHRHDVPIRLPPNLPTHHTLQTPRLPKSKQRPFRPKLVERCVSSLVNAYMLRHMDIIAVKEGVNASSDVLFVDVCFFRLPVVRWSVMQWLFATPIS